MTITTIAPTYEQLAERFALAMEQLPLTLAQRQDVWDAFDAGYETPVNDPEAPIRDEQIKVRDLPLVRYAKARSAHTMDDYLSGESRPTRWEIVDAIEAAASDWLSELEAA